jgi:hypothetical protein
LSTISLQANSRPFAAARDFTYDGMGIVLHESGRKDLLGKQRANL